MPIDAEDGYLRSESIGFAGLSASCHSYFRLDPLRLFDSSTLRLLEICSSPLHSYDAHSPPSPSRNTWPNLHRVTSHLLGVPVTGVSAHSPPRPLQGFRTGYAPLHGRAAVEHGLGDPALALRALQAFPVAAAHVVPARAPGLRLRAAVSDVDACALPLTCAGARPRGSRGPGRRARAGASCPRRRHVR